MVDIFAFQKAAHEDSYFEGYLYGHPYTRGAQLEAVVVHESNSTGSNFNSPCMISLSISTELGMVIYCS